MRKVTREVTDAFFNRRPRKCGNTRTIEMPHGEWINPRKFVGQFADK